MTLNNYKLVLGLEIHMHVKTKTKMFCSCDANIYSDAPNTHTCPTCLGLPGALPVPNLEAIKKTQLLGLALECKLNANSMFDRKHYFYPDLGKGYQISQYKLPLCEHGRLELTTGKIINIQRVHLEEDTAKSSHEGGKTLIDFNKSGMPLIEIVTSPDFRSSEEAVEFCKAIYEIVKTCNISDADMEKGQMRLEANISLRTQEMETENILPTYKVEIKNINSFRFMEKAVKAEIVRQTEILENGGVVEQENRGFNEASGKTVAQRSKEDAHDYRYFPEPDIPPLLFDADYLESLAQFLPELPRQTCDRLVKDFGLSKDSAFTLSRFDNKPILALFLDLVAKDIPAQKAANVLLNKADAKTLSLEQIITTYFATLPSVKDEEIKTIALDVLIANKSAVDNFKNGKEASLMFLVGQVMKHLAGRADAGRVKTLLQELLKQM